MEIAAAAEGVGDASAIEEVGAGTEAEITKEEWEEARKKAVQTLFSQQRAGKITRDEMMSRLGAMRNAPIGSDLSNY